MVWAESSGRVEQSLLCNFLSARIGRAVGCWWAQRNNLAKHYLSLGISGCCATGLCLPPPPSPHCLLLLLSTPPLLIRPRQQSGRLHQLTSPFPRTHMHFSIPPVWPFIEWLIPEAVADASLLMSQEMVPNKMKPSETFIDSVNSTL